MKMSLKTVAFIGAVAAASSFAAADVNVGVASALPWIGYMNVSNLPSAGGAFQFGSGWGTADLVAVFTGEVLKLSPNTIGDTNEYWYQGAGTNPGGPGAPGNKIMDANMYVQDDALAGSTVNFSALVLDNSFTSAHSSVAFIKDFAPDYSSFTTTTIALTPGVFSISLATVGGGHHIQYGFETVGVNVWVTDTAPFGFAEITAAPVVPEPTSMGLLGLVAAPAMLRRRRA